MESTFFSAGQTWRIGIYVYMAISSLTDFNFESFISEKGLQLAYFF